MDAPEPAPVEPPPPALSAPLEPPQPAAEPAAAEPPPAEPPELDAATLDRLRFVHALHALSPTTHVTHAMLALNVLVFVLTVTIGHMGFFEPTAEEARRCGASFGPWTTN